MAEILLKDQISALFFFFSIVVYLKHFSIKRFESKHYESYWSGDEQYILLVVSMMIVVGNLGEVVLSNVSFHCPIVFQIPRLE